jgi:CRP-like cAMP-binding protein
MTNDDRREKTLKILKRGDIFGLESMGQDGRSNVRAVAHEESWVSVLTRDQFLRIAVNQPSLYFNLIQILLHRLADAREDVKALCFMDIQERLAQTLLKLAQTHGQRMASRENMVRLRVRLSHDYLAGMIGSNRPYLSNIMSSFKKQGWIAYGNHHLLVDVDALKTFVG